MDALRSGCQQVTAPHRPHLVLHDGHVSSLCLCLPALRILPPGGPEPRRPAGGRGLAQYHDRLRDQRAGYSGGWPFSGRGHEWPGWVSRGMANLRPAIIQNFRLLNLCVDHKTLRASTSNMSHEPVLLHTISLIL